MWNGKEFRFAWSEQAPPQYRFQAAYDGDYFSFIGLFDRAEAMYARAVTDNSLKPGSYADWMTDGHCPLKDDDRPDKTEPSQIKAYAAFRLVELYARMNQNKSGKKEMQFLENNFPQNSPGYIYASLAGLFWQEYEKQADISSACAVVQKKSEDNKAAVFGLFGEYGYFNLGPNIDTICPFGSLPE
jgi:hypothetical protein